MKGPNKLFAFAIVIIVSTIAIASYMPTDLIYAMVFFSHSTENLGASQN